MAFHGAFSRTRILKRSLFLFNKPVFSMSVCCNSINTLNCISCRQVLWHLFSSCYDKQSEMELKNRC